MTTPPTPDDIFRETVAVRQRLQELSSDDHHERSRLEDRLAELRSQAAEIEREAGMGRESLQAHLGNLERRLRDILDGHLSQSAAAQTGRGGGLDPEHVHRLNRQIDEGAGVDGLRETIARVRRLLDES